MKFKRNHARLQKSSARDRGGKATCQFSGALEKLEDRQMLTVFMVDTLLDDGSAMPDGLISLREAFVAAETNAPFGDAPAGDVNGDSIQFDNSIANQTISLNFGQLVTTDDLMVGSAATRVTIDGNDASRIFLVDGPESWTFTNMTLTSANAPGVGGAICYTGVGNIDVNNVLFLDNNAQGNGGGGIYNQQGSFNIFNSGFEGNTADDEFGRGGGILSDDGTITLTQVDVIQNAARLSGGGIDIGAGNLNVFVSLIDDNSAGELGPVDFGRGGGINVRGDSEAMVQISETPVTNNSASDQGGGIWNQAGSQVFVRTLSTVIGNTASGDESTDGGGGIYNNGGFFQVQDATISNNMADGALGSGGAIFAWGGSLIVRRTNIFANAANRAGGGLEVMNALVTLEDSVLGGGTAAESNVAGSTSLMGLAGAPGNGGGLNISGAMPSLVDIDNTIVRNNRAANEGGGLWNHEGSTLIIQNGSDISYNFASGNESFNGGGGVYNNGGTLNVVDSSFFRNRARGAAGSGGGIFSTNGLVQVTNSDVSTNFANRAGGGIEVIDGGVTLTESSLGNNVAGPEGSASPGNGGGLHVTGSAIVELDNAAVFENFAAREGGGLWNSGGGTMTVRNGTALTDNGAFGDAADDGGGGIFNNGGTLNVLDSVVAENRALGMLAAGGGIFTTDGNVTITASTINDNLATRAGGGIEIVGGIVDITESDFNFNDAGLIELISGLGEPVVPGFGGGIHIAGNATVVVDSSSVTENEAGTDGGGIWNSATGSLTVRNATSIDQNVAFGEGADHGGGGIFNNGGTLNVLDSFVVENLAVGENASGGGIFSVDGDVDVVGSMISGNLANRAGGGIEIVDGTIDINASEVSFNDAGEVDMAEIGGGLPVNPGFGGGLHVTGTGAAVIVEFSIFENNEAGTEGGGLWNQSGVEMIIRNDSLITENRAFGEQFDEGGGGIFNNGGTLRLLDSTVASNHASGLAGSGGGILSADGILDIQFSTIRSNSASRAGGGIEIREGSATLLDTTIGDLLEGTGLGGNIAGTPGMSNPGNGGGLHVSGPGVNVVIDGGTVAGNSAALFGGGLYSAPGSTMTIQGGATIANNEAVFGGGLFAGGTTEAIDSFFSDNNAVAGAGIFIDEGVNVELNTPNINDNVAIGQGGGIFNQGTLNITDGGLITNNIASNGGGIFTDVTGTTNEGDVTNTGNVPNDRN